MSKVLLSFKNMSGAGLITRSQAVILGMTGNTNFPKPVPAIAVLTAATKKFSDALAATVSRDIAKILLKDEAREELEATLTELGGYVNYASGGNAAIQATSGYPISKQRTGKRPLGIIKNFSVQPGKNTGDMVLSVDGVENVKGYMALWGRAPIVNDTWKHTPGDASTVISNLESGVQFSFRMCAHGAHGQVVYSEIITKWVG